MVSNMDQQKWSLLEDVTMAGFDKVNNYAMFQSNGTFEAMPMMYHLHASSPHVQGIFVVLQLDESRPVFSLE
jgi:hypothetical protein